MSNALITNRNNPKVISVTGNVSITNNGFTTTLSKDNIIATIIAYT